MKQTYTGNVGNAASAESQSRGLAGRQEGRELKSGMEAVDSTSATPGGCVRALEGSARGMKASRGLLCLLLFGSATALWGQLPTATVFGSVSDASNGLLVGATVTVQNNSGVSRTVKTGADGSYRFPALEVGEYTETIDVPGFKTEKLRITLTVGQEVTENVTLQVGSEQQTVDVTSEQPLVNTTNSSLGNLVSQQKLEDLPLNGRNFTDLILLQPGVTQQTNEANNLGADIYSSNGAPTRSNNFLIDGTIMQTFYGFGPTSASGSALGLDGIQEYQVITNMFGAEYGLTMGSQTNIVSKRGTDKLHGDVFEYARNSALDARNYFDYLYQLPATVPGGGQRIPPFQRNQFGGSLGGPLFGAKTFFAAAYESLQEDLGNPLYLGINTVFPASCHGAAGTLLTPATCPLIPYPVVISAATAPFLAQIPLPNVPGTNEYTFSSNQHTAEHYGQMRIDHTFSDKDSMFGRFTIDHTNQLRPRSFQQFIDLADSQNQYLTLGESHVFSGTLLNSARLSFSRTNLGVYTQTSTPAGLEYIRGQGPGITIIAGLSLNPWFGINNNPSRYIQNIYSLGDDLFITRGKHALKVGALGNYFQAAGDQHVIQGGFTIFTSPAGFLGGNPLQVEAPTQANAATGTAASDQNRFWRFGIPGFYVQDDYKVARRLTLNLGLRYEFDTVPNDSHGHNFAIRNFGTASGGLAAGPSTVNFAGYQNGGIMRNASLKNFSPRLGFADDVFGNGKTVLRGGFGVYYDVGNIDSQLLVEAIGTPPSPLQNVLYAPFGAAPYLTTPVDFSTSVGEVVTLDYNSKQPYTMQTNLTIEQQLPGQMVMTVSGVSTRGIHLFALHDGNPVVPSGLVNGVPQWRSPNPAVCPNGAPRFAPPFNSCRQNPGLGVVGADSTVGDSYYNGLQVTVARNVSRGLQYQVSYTYSKLLDTTQGAIPNGADASDSPSNPYNPRFDLGPTVFDVRNNLKINTLFHFPETREAGYKKVLLNGFYIGNIASLQSGYPFSPVIGFNNSNSELGLGDQGIGLANDRPSKVTAANLAAALATDPQAAIYDRSKVIVGKVNEWYNPHMFTLPAPGTLGDVSRGLLTGPALIDWDVSLIKNTAMPRFGDAAKLQIRAEFFNVLNHTSFAFPGTTSNQQNFVQTGATTAAINPVAGLVASTTSNARQVQLAVRLEF